MRSGLSPHAEALLVLVSFVGFNNILPRGITSSVGDSTQPAAEQAHWCARQERVEGRMLIRDSLTKANELAKKALFFITNMAGPVRPNSEPRK